MVAFVLLGVAALLAAAWLYLSWNFNYWKDRGVVSYNPFSVTGDRGDGLPIGKPFFQWLDYGYSKYKGKQRFVGTFQARRPVLVALDPEFIKTVLTKDFGSFHSRGMPIDEQGDPLSVNLVFLSGIRWKNLRMKLSPVFTSGKLKLMYPLMVDITKELNGRVRALAATGNNEVEFKDLLVRYSTDIIGSVAFGIDCSTLSGENQQFMDMSRTLVNRNLRNVIRFILVSVHPIFAKLLPFKLLFSEMTNFFLNLMKDTVEYRETNQVKRNDFVQLMMELRNEDRGRTAADRLSHLELNTGTMAAQAFVFFIAGLDNISNTVGFALYELALNTELQQEAADEVQSCAERHGGSISYEALRDMALVERIIREALRKYSPVGVLTRQPDATYQLPDSDVVIDPSVAVWIPTWQTMHDPDIFPEPDRFDPDRFTDEAKQGRHQYAYLPFGEGPRFCIAERFAVLEMKLALASLLHQHVFSVGSKTAVPLVLDPKAGAPTPKDGFWLRVRDRQ